MPPVDVMSEAEFSDYLYELVEAEPQPEVNHLERALVSLGMVEPGALEVDVVVSDLVSGIGGLYRHDTDDIIVVDHGPAVDRDMMSSILLHEFVHYLQDLEVDLEAFTATFSSTSDAALAAASIVEGEAELHQLRYYASLVGLDPNTTDYRERFDSMVSFSESYLLASPSPYTVVRSVFPYAWGGRYVHEVWKDGGRRAVAEQFSSPPLQARTFMSAAGTDVPARSFASPPAPAGYELYSEDVGGAFLLFLYAVTLLDVEAARALALEWRGDRFSILATDDDAQTVVTWRIAFSGSAAAATFAGAVRSRIGSDRVVVEGPAADQVVLATTEDPRADMSFALAPLD